MSKGRRITAALLMGCMAATCLFSGCGGNGENNKEEEAKVEQDRALYVQQYSDFEAAENWKKTYIDDTNLPPVSFWIGDEESKDLEWSKKEGNTTIYTDFSEEAPSKRVVKEITYTNKKYDIKVVLNETTYPGYPVVEYDAKLVNTSKKTSELVEDMLSIDMPIQNYQGTCILHGNRGSTYSYNDFAPITYKIEDTVKLSENTGRPTNEYLPYFNVENVENNTGTIAIVNWQGCWKSTFSKKGDDITLTAGQYNTELNMKGEEELRFPGTVLLFYKGNYMNGQNVYRRWAYECNLFRYEGEHMKKTNVLVCPSNANAERDLKDWEFYRKYDLLEYIDKFNKDADWYEMEGHDWTYTGNWYFNEKNYPNGLKDLAAAAHADGKQFAVWFEPERVVKGTKTVEDLEGKLLSVSGDPANCAKGTNFLVNYADEEAVDYIIELLDGIIKEQGIDQYRQDFNIEPGAFWTAEDAKQHQELGIKRIGATENHYTTGYLKIFDELVKRNPGLYIDCCAGGGRRYDLESMRYSFLHTRSDYWMDIESAQCQTYGSSMWFHYWGTGFTDLSSYDVRSHIGCSIGVGATTKKQAEKLKNALIEWEYIAEYLYYDYYPITNFAGSGSNTMALQYDSPEEGKGMFITYFRAKKTSLIKPVALDPDAKYLIWNYDDKDNTIKTMTGKEIMEGIAITSTAKSAVIYEYVLAEGENTENFRKTEIKTGPGSTDYKEEVVEDKYTKEMPELSSVKYHNRFTDEELIAMYDITGDNQIKFAAVDYRTTGTIYQISKNIYDELTKSSTATNGWHALNKSKTYVRLDSIGKDVYPFTTWDGTYFDVQPFARQAGDSYYLWISNIMTFADSDGGWKNWPKLSILWDKKDGTQGCASVEKFTAEDSEYIKMIFSEMDEDSSGKIFSITEDMFNSFVYTGNCLTQDGVKWFEIDGSKMGIYSCSKKAPTEGVDVGNGTTVFSKYASNDVKAFGAKVGDEFKLWIKNYDYVSIDTTRGRGLLVWYNAEGEICMQAYHLA